MDEDLIQQIALTGMGETRTSSSGEEDVSAASSLTEDGEEGVFAAAVASAAGLDAVLESELESAGIPLSKSAPVEAFSYDSPILFSSSPVWVCLIHAGGMCV